MNHLRPRRPRRRDASGHHAQRCCGGRWRSDATP